MRHSQSVLCALLVAAMTLLSGCDRFTSPQTRMSRATVNLKDGKYQAALVDLRKLLDRNPGNVEARLLLADVLVASGDLPEARQQLERAAADGAPATATEPKELMLLSLVGDGEGLRKALATSKTLSAPQHDTYEGKALLLANKPADAQAAFARALAADPNLNDAAMGRIEAAAAQDHVDEGLRWVDALLTAKPDLGRAWILKGTLVSRKGDYAGAANAFSRALQNSRGLLRGDFVRAHAQLVESYLAAGQLTTARTALEAMDTAVGADSLITHFVRAEVALAGKDATTAVTELRKFTQAAPQNLAGRMLLINALLEQGGSEQAYAEAVRSVAEFHDSDRPRLTLAAIQLRTGRTSDAEETLKPLIARSPPDPTAVATLAEIRIQRGETVAGASLLEQAVAQNPDPRLQLQLAAAYLAGGEAKRAIETLKAIQDNNFAAARDRLHVIATAAERGQADASKELEAAVASHPKDVDLLLMAAAYQAGVNQTDRARAYLQKAREIRPEDPMLAVTLARLELSAGRTDEAETLAKSVLAQNAMDTQAMVLMAGVASKRGKDADVESWLNRARNAKPDAVDVRLALARRAAARGDNVGARSVLTEAIRNAPTNPAPRVALADLDASTGRYPEALNGLQEAAKIKPGSPPILLATARVQLAAKNIDAARRSLQQALEISPGWAPATATLAALEVGSGNLNGALGVVQQMRRANPNGAESFVLEGDVYMAAARAKDAAAAYAKGYAITPGAPVAMRAAQAKLAANLPNPESELVAWLGKQPNDATARRTLAQTLASEGKADSAIAEFEKVIATQPQDYIALNNLAWLYHDKKDPRALEMAKKAYAGAPKVAEIADSYGWILAQTGSMKEGLDVLQKAAELSPNDGDIQFHFAYALSAQGEKQKAAETLRRIVNQPKQFGSLAQARQLLTQLDSTLSGQDPGR